MKKKYIMPETMATCGIVAQSILMSSGPVTPGHISTQEYSGGDIYII